MLDTWTDSSCNGASGSVSHSHLPDVEACAAIQSSFSDYLDGAVSGHAMHAIAAHLKDCDSCAVDFAALQATQQALASLRAQKAPPNLGLKLRLAISREKARRESRWTDALALHWENSIRPMLVQVSAGVAGAVVLIGTLGVLLGVVATPQDVLANDVPLGAVTSPHYLYSASRPRPILTDRDTTIIVDAAINDRGQVYDYKIVSDPQSADVQEQVAEQLMLSVYEPARVFGAPVRGRVIVTFAGISVRG
jgi:hypothetical protein